VIRNDKKDKIPNGWCELGLGQILKPSKLKYEPKKNDAVPYIGLEHIEKDRGKLLGHGKSDEVRSTKSVFVKGDLLYGKLRPYLNKVCIPDFDGICSTDILVFSQIESSLNQYLLYRLLSKDFVRYANQCATGVQHPRVNYRQLSPFLIQLPPLNEQKRIVAKIEQLFSDLDAGVVTLEAIKKQVKQYRQSVLKYAFEGKLTADWRKKNKPEPARKLLEEIAKEKEQKTKGKKQENLPSLDKSNQPELPHGWEWIGLGYLSESMKNGIYKPKQFYSDDGIACLRMYNIDKGKIVWKDIKRMILTKEEFQEYGLNPNDILINRVNSRELVGKAAVIPDTLEKCVYESKNIRLRLISTRLCSRYIGYWFLFFAHQYFTMNAQQVVGMASINQDQIGAMPIPLMDSLEQEEIVEVIEHHYSIADKIDEVVETALKQSNRLRQSILKRAF